MRGSFVLDRFPLIFAPSTLKTTCIFFRVCVPSWEKEHSLTQVHRHGTLCYRKTFIARLVHSQLCQASTQDIPVLPSL